MTSFRQNVVAAALAFATVAAPAIAWAADAPDSAYSVNHARSVQARSAARAYDNSVARTRYYDVAPAYTYQTPGQDLGAYAASQPHGFQDLH
jgi:hypothetical protein